MIALIDGDIVAYRVGWTTNDSEFSIAEYRIDTMVEGILEAVGATDFYIYLTDSPGNYRNQISPTYKATRKEEKPKWLEEIKEYLISEWKAKISLGQEADDALGIYQSSESLDGTWFEGHYNTIICSIDKDLLQIPGLHYNFVRMEHSIVTPEEGMYNFYKQLLVGDSTDNVNGCPKTGEVKAAARLSLYKGSADELGTFEAVRQAYRDYYTKKGLTNEQIDDIILINARLLYIRKKEEEMWQIPLNSQIQPISTQQLPQSPVDQLSSTISTEADLNQCMEPILQMGMWNQDTGYP